MTQVTTVVNDIHNAGEIYRAVNRFNAMLSEMLPEDDRIVLGKLNHTAGRRAEASGMWKLAIDYYRRGLEAISAVPAASVGDLDSKLNKCLVYALSRAGQITEALALCDALLGDPRNAEDLAALRWLRAVVFQP